MTSTPGTPAAGPVGSAAPPPRRLRASDADRAAMVARLQAAVGHGLLTLDEGDQRMAAAFAARYVDELSPLTADLPAPVPAEPFPVGWQRLGESFVAQLRHELRTTASSGVRSWWFAATALAVVLFVFLTLAVVGAVLHGVAEPGEFHEHFMHR
jgi:DUF1707 SHOCT-like domain